MRNGGGSSAGYGRAATLRLIGVLALAVGCATAPSRPGGSGGKPNILFLFADDQSFEMIHALGNEELETPHLDRLVAQGAVFTHVYNQGGWNPAICVASRTMLHTGRFVWQAHRIAETAEEERREGRFWPEYMKKAGYGTYMTGKWHVKADPEKAFDHVLDVRPGMPRQTPDGYNRPHEGQPNAWSPSDPRHGGYWEGGKHWSEIVGDHAVTFLGQASRSAKPFFMYVAFNAPHDPRQSPREYVDKYPVDQVKVPADFQPDYPGRDAIGLDATLRDEKLAPFPRTEDAVRLHRREYHAIVTHMDAQIGRILAALEESGKARDTYVFFTADNGLAAGHHGLMGKQNQYEHSVRVPFIVNGPGIDAGRRLAARIYLQDVMPTVLELAGVDRPGHVEFRSVLPLLRGERQDSHDAIYGAYMDFQRMIIHDDHKLILYPKDRRVLLFDLKEDPAETRNLAGDPSKPVVDRLFARLLELQKETGDALDLRAAYPDLGC
jgi:arylsulfatase A-like enzyme